MSEDAPHRSHVVRWVSWGAVAALVVYVLSIGPVNASDTRAHWSVQTWERLKLFYAPVRCLEGLRPVSEWIYDYEIWWVRWWRGPPLPTSGLSGRFLYDPLFHP